jgi:hypothetical protein
MDTNPVLDMSIGTVEPERGYRNIYCSQYRDCLGRAARVNGALDCYQCELKDSRNDWDRRY